MAKILGIGRNTAYEACRNGEISTIRIGGRVLIPCSAIDDLLSGAA
jgi:excisionase family DNA binding protein